MSQGLVNAFGVQGGFQSLDQVLAQRIAEKHYADQQAEQQFKNQLDQQHMGLLERGQTLAEQQRKDALAETTRLHNIEDEKNRIGEANTLGEQLPGGSFLPPTDPAVGMLRSGGRGQLLQPQQERPAVDVGPLQPGDTGAARQQGFIKLPTFNQNLKTQEEARKAAADEAKGTPKEPTPHFTFMPSYDESGKPNGITIGDQLTGNVRTQGGSSIRPTPPVAGAATAATEARHRQEASGALDQLDQAIEGAKDLIGPGAGRVTNLQQLAGMADPRAQALGTKMLMAKLEIDRGLGGMRAAASPQLLARWDNFLGNKVTPEGLHAAVQAMREILNAGGSAGGGVVRKYNPATGKIE